MPASAPAASIISRCRSAHVLRTDRPDSFRELFDKEIFTDPLNFPDYREKFDAAKGKSRENEGVLCGTATIGGHRTALFVTNPAFMMGSMGTVVGDRITALFEYAIANRLPVIGYTVSGGHGCRRNAVPDADGKNLRRRQAAQRCRASVHRRAYRPNHGRRNRQLCHAGRHHLPPSRAHASALPGGAWWSR